jgi:hypothetical protein
MNAEAVEIRLQDLTRLDQLEISKQLPSDSLRFESEPHSRDTHGELATVTAVVVVSVVALRVLAAYLMKKSNRKSFKKSLEIIKSDGTRQIVTIEYNDASSEAPEAEILKQLGTACEVDLSAIT